MSLLALRFVVADCIRSIYRLFLFQVAIPHPSTLGAIPISFCSDARDPEAVPESRALGKPANILVGCNVSLERAPSPSNLSRLEGDVPSWEPWSEHMMLIYIGKLYSKHLNVTPLRVIRAPTLDPPWPALTPDEPTMPLYWGLGSVAWFQLEFV